MTAFSILVPSYNPGRYFTAALDSALEQMSADDELVIQDAGSTDGSAQYLEKLAVEDARVRVVVERDDGQSDALNRGLARAANNWVIWLNADDLLLPGSLIALRDAIASTDSLDLVVGAHQIVRSDGSVVDTFPGRALEVEHLIAKGCAAFSGSLVMRRDYLRDVGAFESHLHTVMDLSLQLRMAETHPRQTLLPTPIGALRFHERSKTANLWPQFVKESHAVRRRHATGVGQKTRVWTTTVFHTLTWPVFRFRLTPTYRRVRRLTRRD